MENEKKTARIRQSGQALVEYALIVTLVIISFALALAATGPAIGNVFSNTIYNLVGADPYSLADLPGVEDFWLTVTWVAEQTPESRSLATRTIPPPTQTPTSESGIPPSATPTVPTATPSPTNTPQPSPTPQDIQHVAPWTDSADELVNWRLDNTFYVGSEDWLGFYYGNRELSGTPAEILYNEEIDPTKRSRIDFDWGSGAPITGMTTNNFSVMWRRPIWIQQTTTLRFDLTNVDNGVRIWIVGGIYGGDPSIRSGGPGNCSSRSVTSGGLGPAVGSAPNSATGSPDKWNLYTDSFFGFNPTLPVGPSNPIPGECLIVDRWMHENTARSASNVLRTVPAGLYMIQVDYYEETNNARIKVDISNPAQRINPDDTAVTAAGATTSGQPVCTWMNENTTNSNSLANLWNVNPQGSTTARGTRCHMELRGSVEVPADITNPVFAFWDVWDMPNADITAYLEVADYDPNNDGVFDRSALSWQRVNLRSGNTFNYNWKYNVVDLTSYLATSTSRKLTFRFVVENRNTTSTIRWLIDSMYVGNQPRPDLFTALHWTLDDPAQKADFITSGRWDLTSEVRLGNDGMSWHESIDSNTSRMTVARANDSNLANFRAHTIEFNGFINVSDPRGATDLDGDTGVPVLSFWHQYNLAQRVGLRVEWTSDPYNSGTAANWQTVTGGDLISISQTSRPSIPVLSFVEIPLNTIPVTRFRLRFAMYVRSDSSVDRTGWYVDDIKLERAGYPEYVVLPFVDQAENPTDDDNWIVQGGWARVEGGRRPTPGTPGFSWTDSPNGNYLNNANVVMQLKKQIDFFMDSPENPRSSACNLGPGLCEAPLTAAERPFMTFWTRRILASGERLSVEWKRAKEGATDWKEVWVYHDQMQTNGSGNRAATRVSRGWERVEINLEAIAAVLRASNNPADPYDDDVELRIRFITDGSNNEDGWYLDDIVIRDEPVRIFRLWAEGQTRTNSSGTILLDDRGNPAVGNSSTYLDGVDNNQDLFLGAWHFGGEWDVINWERRDGLLAFHESPRDQGTAPPAQPRTEFSTPPQTFNVLEMATEIDLRGVNASDRPVMFFWSRWAVGSGDAIRVEISHRDPSRIGNHACRSYANNNQCYEKLYGWSEWSIVDTATNLWRVNGTNQTYTWQRQQIPLDQFAQSPGADGRIIRIRFVFDALNTNTKLDGWYIDGISIRYEQPRVFPIGKTLSPGIFFDGARNMNNWVAEGLWGLDPEFYRGSGGGPASLGSSTWNYRLFDLRNCTAQGYSADPLTCANSWLNDTTVPINPGVTPNSGTVLSINYDWGAGGPAAFLRPDGTADAFAGRWVLQTAQVGTSGLVAGTYTFIVSSDDGVRMRYAVFNQSTGAESAPPVSPGDPPIASQFWNIINSWQYRGRTVDMGTARLANNTRYRFVVEYFEGSGDASLRVSTGSNSFSFTDSPKAGPGLSFPEIPAMHRSNSSLILDGVFDFTQATNPIIRYYTYHELGGDARVEVTTDGGFTWTNAGLEGSRINNVLFTTPWVGRYYADTVPVPANQRDRVRLDFNWAMGANPAITPAHTRNDADINFNWSGSPFSGWRSDNFSVRWTNSVTLTEPTVLRFRVRADDGVRLWVNYSPGCIIQTGSNPGIIVSGQPSVSVTNNTLTNGGSATFATGCLMIDNWRDQGSGDMTVERAFLPGTYTFQLDYYEATGGAFVNLDVSYGGFDNPNYNGTWMPFNNAGTTAQDWREKVHDLRDYAGRPAVGLRFRLDRLSRSDIWEGGSFQTSNQTPVNWPESWWIVDINVIDP